MNGTRGQGADGDDLRALHRLRKEGARGAEIAGEFALSLLLAECEVTRRGQRRVVTLMWMAGVILM